MLEPEVALSMCCINNSFHGFSVREARRRQNRSRSRVLGRGRRLQRACPAAKGGQLDRRGKKTMQKKEKVNPFAKIYPLRSKIRPK